MLPTLHQTVIPGRHLPFVLLPHANRPSEHTSVEVQPAMRRMDSNLWQRRWRCWPPQAVAAVQAPSHQAAASRRYSRCVCHGCIGGRVAVHFVEHRRTDAAAELRALRGGPARCASAASQPADGLSGAAHSGRPASLPPSHHRRIVPTSDPNHAPRRTAA
jgi:hypothetical protein